MKPGKRKLIPLLQHNMRSVLERSVNSIAPCLTCLTRLFRTGVHWIRDPDTGKYNFPEYLETIPQVADFAFDRLPGFVPSSQDKVYPAFASASAGLYSFLWIETSRASEESELQLRGLDVIPDGYSCPNILALVGGAVRQYPGFE